jgi:hypothetical protein
VPNGKPGDHWYTDVTVHRLTVFSPVVDELIRDIDAEAQRRDAGATERWQQPVRHRLEEIVEGHLALIGYETLASRGTVDGPEWHLSVEELGALEADVRAYRASLS